jgi:hypothetical protein
MLLFYVVLCCVVLCRIFGPRDPGEQGSRQGGGLVESRHSAIRDGLWTAPFLRHQCAANVPQDLTLASEISCQVS